MATVEFLPPCKQPFVVTSEFGWRTHPITGAQELHNGIDLAVNGNPTNTPIYASAAGTVIFSGVLTGGWESYGNYVVIRHSNGFCTGYAHLASISVSVNAQVNQGQQLGIMGTTGSSTGIHLHFQLITDHTDIPRIAGNSSLFINPRDRIDFSLSGGTDTGGGNGGDNGGGGDNGSGGSGKPTIDLLKVNRFMYPEPSRKFVQLSAESIDDSYPKYHLIRTVFNRQLEKSHPDLIKYINSLQGDYGLEKLCCSPITTLTLTNGKGIQKNFNLADFKNQEEEFPVYVKGFLGKSNQVEFYFGDYLNLTEFPLHGSSSALPEAIIRKDALMDQTPKNFDLYIDTEKSYEYLNYNTIKQSMDNASFTLSQNQLQAANAERNFKLEQDKQTQLNQIAQTGARKGLDITQGGAWQQFGINQVQRNIGGAIGVGANLLGGNFLGAGLGAASIGFNVGMDAMGLNAAQNTQNQALANSHATANQALAASQGAGEQIFMNSLATSQLIATNNYENTIANINAGLADLKNQPDISAISGADYNFEMAYDNDDIHCVIYTTNPQALHTLATFYAMYGYSIKRYDDISKYMKVRRSFNYVKTQGANIKGKVSNKWRNNLNMIFDSGITFWRDTEKMEKGDITGNYAT